MAKLRPLGKVMECLEEIGYPITHAYDDLIFVEHTPFLLRFDEEDTQTLYYYGHVDCTPEENNGFFEEVARALKSILCTVVNRGRFAMEQKPGGAEEIDISFYE